MSIEEFASRVGVSVEDIELYRKHGLLDPEDDGFDARDLLRMEYVRNELARGATVDTLAESFRTSTNDLTRNLFQRVHGTFSDEEAAERVGLSVDELNALQTALGFPRGVRFGESDLAQLSLAKRMMDAGMPWEAMLEGARVYSDSLRRLADASLRMTHRFLCEPLIAAGQSEREVSRNVGDAIQVISPASQELVNFLLVALLREAAIDHAIAHLEPRSKDAAPGTEEATIVFVDVALFSTLAELEGDEAAVGLIDRVDRAVRELSIELEGRIIKQIGDEFMLVFREPANAVRFAVGLHEDMSRTDPYLGLRTGIHSGSILYRLGDYYGRAVNIAARIVSMSLPNTILITEPVAKAAADVGIDVEEVGVRELRGMEKPIPIYRVVR